MSQMSRSTADLIGVLCDTHGLLRPEAMQALQGVDLIFHAGDIGKPQVLEELSAIAPVIAVRGNNDQGQWAEAIPESRVFEMGAVSIYLLHDLKQLDIEPAAASFKVLISGHSPSTCGATKQRCSVHQISLCKDAAVDSSSYSSPAILRLRISVVSSTVMV